jgi:DNA-binding XRE family transcriptional regulator
MRAVPAPKGPPSPRLGAFLSRRRQQIDRTARSLGPYLRLAERIGKRVSQEEMAEALDVTRQWYGMLEVDAAHASAALLNRISSVLSLQYDEHVELLRLGIPELDVTGSDDPAEVQLLDALSFAASAALTASSSSHLEAAARLVDELRQQYFSGALRPSHLRPGIFGLEQPDETRNFPKGRLDIVTIGGTAIGRAVYEPGWKWTESLKPTVQTDSCQASHLGHCASGRMRFRTDQGQEFEMRAGNGMWLPPGHDSWTVGNEPCVMFTISKSVKLYRRVVLPDAERCADPTPPVGVHRRSRR